MILLICFTEKPLSCFEASFPVHEQQKKEQDEREKRQKQVVRDVLREIIS